MDQPGAQNSSAARALAWCVHLFTASGVVLALLALVAVETGQWREALLWLLVAVVVDGIDGTFARAVRIRERLPRIDGDVLDLVIDYLTYVFVPALFIWRGNYLPDWAALPLVALILLSSLYVFARRDMKTEDGYFRGFPALWILVAFYFFAAPPHPAAAAAMVALLVVLTFAPVLVIHPFRARDFGRWPPLLATVWAISSAALLFFPNPSPGYLACLSVSLAATAVLAVMGLVRTARGERRSSP